MTREAIEFPLEERPRLRPVEAFPIEEDGQRYLLLRDPSDSDVEPIVVSDGAVELLSLLDGERSIEGLHTTLVLRGASIGAADVRSFLEQLDLAGYLEGPRAQHRRRRKLDRFHANPLRSAVHAGGAYPDGLAELPQFLAAGYLHDHGPGSLPGRRNPRLAPPRGVIAPHVDLHRGAPTYSWAYKAIAEAQPADLYVVLGTCHTPVEGSFAATRKPYDTPLGSAPSDVEFLDHVQRLWGRDLFEGEFSHASEHSIEFQAVYLRSLGLAGAGGAPIAPILCDSLHALVMPPYSPCDVAIVSDFVAALRQAIAEDGRRITVIAAVDFAHIGPRFGDPAILDSDRMDEVERADREMLDLVCAGDAEGYFRQVMRDRDARRICGFTPIYLLTELMGSEGRSGNLLRYTQWVAADWTSSVTFGSVVFR